MITLGRRIKSLRGKLNMTQKELAAVLQIPRETLANWEIDRGNPSIEMLIRLADCFTISIDYLVGRSNPQILNQCSDYSLDDTSFMDCNIVARLPVYTSISNWEPFTAVHESDEYELLDTSYAQVNLHEFNDYFYLKVKDDSMSPQMCNEDIILIHQQSAVDNGQIGLIFFNKKQKALIKRITILGDKVILNSDNPAYGQMIHSVDECKIIGQVIKIIKTAR